jgi:hypothetical protein
MLSSQLLLPSTLYRTTLQSVCAHTLKPGRSCLNCLQFHKLVWFQLTFLLVKFLCSITSSSYSALVESSQKGSWFHNNNNNNNNSNNNNNNNNNSIHVYLRADLTA